MEPGLQVWSEAEARREVGGRDRYDLGPSKTLVIWTTPPGPRELRVVLDTVAPEKVYVFAVDPGLDHPEGFPRRLAGLIKHALRSSDGRVSVSALAAATAQREATVRVGVAWLASGGQIAILGEGGNELKLAAGDQKASADLKEVATQLKMLLGETVAYRAHFDRAPAESLFEGKK